MEKIMQGALSANAASLGLNWIYNLPYLERLEKKEDLLFQKADPAKYKRARKAVLAYPSADVGDVSLQGEILKWLYKALKDNPELSREEYKNLVYDNIQPGGPYRGWVESYGQKLIFNRTIEKMELDREPLPMNDDQLVGFIPWIATKALGLSNDKAWDLAQAFTDNEEYRHFYDVFDRMIDDFADHSVEDALRRSLEHVPKQYGFKLNVALNGETPKDILKVVSTGCAIGYALPLIYSILKFTDGFEDAVRMNTRFGGASSDRGTLIGALYAFKEDVPESFIEKTKLDAE